MLDSVIPNVDHKLAPIPPHTQRSNISGAIGAHIWKYIEILLKIEFCPVVLRPLYILYCYSCVIMGKGYGDYARLNLKPIQVENLFST